MADRPTFYHPTNDSPCRASGIIYMHTDNLNVIRFLMIVTAKDDGDELEPAGGKTDEKDKDILDTAIREAHEELNGVIQTSKDALTESVYCKPNKYIVFFVAITSMIAEETFGDREIYEDIPRKVKWLTYDEIANYKIRKIDKKLFMSKIKMFVDPERKAILGRVFEPGILLPKIFDGVDFKKAASYIYSDLDCTVKEHGRLFCVTYRDGLNLWTNAVIPYKIAFMSENRGTIYEMDGPRYKLVSLPFEKFWNQSHPFSYKAPEIFDDGMEGYEKIDGFIIKVFSYRGTWHVATNSIIDSTEVFLRNSKMNAREIFNECAIESKLNWDLLCRNHTYVFEMVHPLCRLVVPYEKPQLFHLMTRDNETLMEIDSDISIQKPRKFDFKTHQQCLEYVNSLHFTNGEGLIVICNTNTRSHHRIKYKSPSYNAEHLLLETTLNEKKILDNYLFNKWATNEEHLLTKYHPELIDKFNAIKIKLSALEQIVKEYQDTYPEKVSYYTNIPQKLKHILTKMYQKPDLRHLDKTLLFDSAGIS
ncbi:MAG: nucleolar GTP-binding protein 1 [Hyperionvirus sp.]|uniref:Nucleolar GTP-binding protein 1 n=1 Tax=Hyperionvirus sp. TaxID=2487770 RepID=A0A3G5ABB2_9VIRU|nr:MAG: nucleolar GTP-binding protein 1 [Hyperionvirus sp.]